MVEMERDQKLKNLLVGKTAFQDLFDPTNKTKRLTKKGDRIEREELDNFSWNELKKIKVKEDEASRRPSSASRSWRRSRSASTTRCSRRNRPAAPRRRPAARRHQDGQGVRGRKRKLSVGDKMAGRHGNKGVVSKVCPKRTCRTCRTARRSRSC